MEAWDQFLEDCGLAAPLSLEWDDGPGTDPVRASFDRPALVAGCGSGADLVLDGPGVEPRHVYFQVVEGRLFAIDLESRHGLRWGGLPRGAGWVDPCRPVRIGGVTLRVIGGAGGQVPAPAAPGPPPLSPRYVSRRPLPATTLEFRGAGGQPRRCPMERGILLIGRSERCQVRLRNPDAPPFIGSLVRTPAGVWVVDLLSGAGVEVNGIACREARLEDGDVLRVGDGTIRILYERLAPLSSSSPCPSPSPSPALASPGRAVVTGRPAAVPPSAPQPSTSPSFSPEAILRPFLEGEYPAPEGASPFGQALLMLIRLLGDMHHEHMALVREELEQIRRLHAEMAEARAELAAGGRAEPGPVTGPTGAAASKAPEGPSPRPSLTRAVGTWNGQEGPPGPRLSPLDVHVVVGERLAAWEHERQSRWRKVVDLLTAGR
jgi:pSer/pThr/pTyr-binding forkhead associated (FHA) protein